MRKTRMISVIAASLLTATVVFTGCGGGGSSTSTGSSSSSTSAGGSSSAPTITPKNVVVADGYVLGANVTSGSETAVATSPGHYQFADASKIANVIVSMGGVNDLNEDGEVSGGEPAAPTLKAPASYSHVTPLTTVMVETGLDAQSIINYYNSTYGLNLTTLDFNPVTADAKVKAEVLVLGYLLSLNQQGASIAVLRGDPFPEVGATQSSESTGTDNSSSSSEESTSSSADSESSSSETCLPGTPCASSEGTESSEGESASSENSTGSTDVFAGIKSAIENNMTLEEVFAEKADVLNDIRNKVLSGSPEEAACNFAEHKVCGGEGSGGSSESSEASSSSETTNGAFPENNTETTSSTTSSDMSESSSSESSEATSSTASDTNETAGSDPFPEK